MNQMTLDLPFLGDADKLPRKHFENIYLQSFDENPLGSHYTSHFASIYLIQT